MTEAEWLTTKLPLYMLREYPAEWDKRKVRLYTCGCLRGAASAVFEERTWALVDTVERCPDSDAELFPAMERIIADWAAADPERFGSTRDGFVFAGFLASTLPDELLELLRTTCYRVTLAAAPDPASDPDGAFAERERVEVTEKLRQADLIREVFGNPFRPVRAEPAWLTSDVLALARGIYDDKAFDRMPILADALQDAGCDNVNVLDHCREEREHVRGCWVIDMLLGKG